MMAVNNGRTNLLSMQSLVCKSFTFILLCKRKLCPNILIVSAKADVREEWKKLSKVPENFSDFVFLASDDLLRESRQLKMSMISEKTAVLFLTLQDLQGDEIKDKPSEVLLNQIDLLIVDETHFGARGEEYGKSRKMPVSPPMTKGL